MNANNANAKALNMPGLKYYVLKNLSFACFALFADRKISVY
jgi:hypothetical protein